MRLEQKIIDLMGKLEAKGCPAVREIRVTQNVADQLDLTSPVYKGASFTVTPNKVFGVNEVLDIKLSCEPNSDGHVFSAVWVKLGDKIAEHLNTRPPLSPLGCKIADLMAVIEADDHAVSEIQMTQDIYDQLQNRGEIDGSFLSSENLKIVAPRSTTIADSYIQVLSDEEISKGSVELIKYEPLDVVGLLRAVIAEFNEPVTRISISPDLFSIFREQTNSKLSWWSDHTFEGITVLPRTHKVATGSGPAECQPYVRAVNAKQETFAFISTASPRAAEFYSTAPFLQA